MREPDGASGLPSYGGEEGARGHGGASESTGNGQRASEAESRETPTMATLEDGSPAVLAPHRSAVLNSSPPVLNSMQIMQSGGGVAMAWNWEPLHRWWAEGEQTSCQLTAGEEAEVGGRAGICEPLGFQGWAQEWVPTLEGSDPWLCRSVQRRLVGRGGRWLSVSGGLRHALNAAGRWWAGHWVGSRSGEIIHEADGKWRSVSRQSPLHNCGEILLRTIFRQKRRGLHSRGRTQPDFLHRGIKFPN